MNRNHRYMESYAKNLKNTNKTKDMGGKGFTRMANQKWSEAKKWDKNTIIALCILGALILLAMI